MAPSLWLNYGVALCLLPLPFLATSSVVRRNGIIECSDGVEYPGLGCFTLEAPFTNTAWLPQSPNSIGLLFQLYTRANSATPDNLSAGNVSSIISSHFNSRLPVKFIVHGFLQNAAMDFIVSMKNALLNKNAMNVIVVGWGQGAGIPYSRAVANTRVVGAATAELISLLQQVTGIMAQQVHLIGHSLGAHVAGYAGALTPNLGRITGLDPAQPSFSGYGEAVRLDRADARFVDVIHSDAVTYNTVQGYGMIEPVGHIDFYPNGGHHQPGCHEDRSVLDFIEDAVYNGMSTAEVTLSCSHERSTELFTSSIGLSSRSSSCSFLAVSCASEESYVRGECLDCGNHPCPVMGFDADRSFGARGVFYLNTTGASPFCGHHYFVSVILSHNMTSTDGSLSLRLRGDTGRQMGWKFVKQGRFMGGDRVSTMLMGDLDIGEVNEVDILFRYSGSRLLWRGDSLVLKAVEVDSVMKFPRKHFCQSSVTIWDGLRATLHSGTFDQSECP
jgi:pancreatic lipase-related protein 1